jgi:signal transduction histidine kinase
MEINNHFHWIKTFCFAVLILAAGCNDSSNKQQKKNEIIAIDTVFASVADSLEWVLKTGTPEMQAQAFNKITSYYWYNDIPKAFEYAWKGKQFADRENNRIYQGEALENLAKVYRIDNEIDSALYYYEAAYAIWKELKDTIRMPNSWASIGAMQAVLNRPEEAIENNKNALEYYQRIGNKESMSIALASIANAYSNMGITQKFIEYTLQAIKLQEEINDTIGLGISYANLCTKLMDIDNYTDAVKYGEKSIAEFRKAKNTFYIGLALLRTCQAILNSPDNGRSIDWETKVSAYLNEASTISNTIQNKHLKYEILVCQSEYEVLMHNYEKAKLLAERVLALTDTSRINSMMAAYNLVFDAIIGNNKEAALYFKKFIEYRNRLHQQEWTNKISEMELKYETEKKELKISALEKEKKLGIGLTVAGGVMLLLVLGLLLSRQRLSVQKRKLAENKIIQLEKEQQLFAAQSLFKGQEDERNRLAKDLHDGLGGLLSGVKLQLGDVKENLILTAATGALFDRALNRLDESIAEMRRVAHNMMPETLMKLGLQQALQDYCDRLNTSPSLSIKTKFYGLEQRIDPTTEVIIYRIVQELVNNAVKHSKASTILVQVMQQDDILTITVEDNGKGFDVAAAEAKNTAGLQNIRTRVNYLNGTIDIESKQDVGTSVYVECVINS